MAEQKLENTINHPFGEQDVQTLAFADPLAVEVNQAKTLVNVTPTAVFVLNVTFKAGANFSVNGGEELVISGVPDGAHTVTAGTGVGGPVQTLVTSVKNTLTYERQSDGLFYPKSLK